LRIRFTLGNCLSTTLAERRLLLRAGFSLDLQDNWGDVFNVLKTLRNENRKTTTTMIALENLEAGT